MSYKAQLKKMFSVLNLSVIAAGLVVLLSAVLVVGRHFDARFAGGEGIAARSSVRVVAREQSVDVMCDGVDATRVNVVTCSGERKKIVFGTSTIWMDENTVLVVANNREGQEAVTFYGGRVVVEGPVEIHVRELVFATEGTVSLVNFSWLNVLDVFALQGGVTSGESTVVPFGLAKRFDTLAPYDATEEIGADVTQSSAREFYAWVEGT